MQIDALFDIPSQFSDKITELRRNQCRYPTPMHQPHGVPMIFCGRAVVPGTSWCPHHKSKVLRTRQEQIQQMKINDKHKLNKAHLSVA